MDSSLQPLLANTWFFLLGLILAFYVITDGFDLGIGILSLVTRRENHRSAMFESIGHVWDANETWLVVLGGALFGAFPAVYATVLSAMYGPVMVMIGGLILRGASFEFRHAARSKRGWDWAFGSGSLIAALAQGAILGQLISGFSTGWLGLTFSAVAALGVASGYALMGATYLVMKTSGSLEQASRHHARLAIWTTVVMAAILTLATPFASIEVRSAWFDPRRMPVFVILGAAALLAFLYILRSARRGGVRGPFRASVLLFLVSFGGLALSIYPAMIPGHITILQAASSAPTLLFMLIGIGMLLPVMIGYNAYQYLVFRGKIHVHDEAEFIADDAEPRAHTH
ncbi:MAG: cytochrome d ubiquinol oxidase subunit II [Burkholderiales bacterium]|jgi:cytochrome d ubiquinol oxidase subunit II|nr:cytochrome d ubiquinol oxidase subunit II [Burkholderiales bacterium]